jgi:hypothetical protein
VIVVYYLRNKRKQATWPDSTQLELNLKENNFSMEETERSRGKKRNSARSVSDICHIEMMNGIANHKHTAHFTSLLVDFI